MDLHENVSVKLGLNLTSRSRSLAFHGAPRSTQFRWMAQVAEVDSQASNGTRVKPKSPLERGCNERNVVLQGLAIKVVNQVTWPMLQDPGKLARVNMLAKHWKPGKPANMRTLPKRSPADFTCIPSRRLTWKLPGFL